MAKFDQTDQKILEAASSLLLTNGYRGTTTRKIAEVAGLNEGTIFRHFADKKSILMRLVEDYLADIRQIADGFTFEGDIVGDFQRIGQRYGDVSAAHKGILLTGLRDAYQFPEVGQAISQLPSELRRILLARFPKMISDGEIRADININVEVENFIAMIFGNAVYLYAYPETDLGVPTKQFVEQNVRVFAQHLKP